MGAKSGVLLARGIYGEQYEKEEGEAPKGGAAIAEEWEWNADYGHQTEYHPYIDKDMEYQKAGHTIGIYSPEV